jgi:D-glycero-alpha-D-manno-heptose-7-phosphate kinase
MIIRARSPLRLGLAGGGTDVSPYCDVFGGCILNATVDHYAYATIETLDNGRVEFCSSDRNQQACYDAAPFLAFDGQLDLFKAVYNRVVRDFNQGRPLSLRLTSRVDVPSGSGLGGSSTLVVAILKAFAELLTLPMGDYDLAQTAYLIERIDAGLHGGKQDHYAAAFGGFNFMEFAANEYVLVNPLRIKENVIAELEASIVLFYTGQSRDSADIIAEQSLNVETRKDVALEAMHQIKREAMLMKESLLRGNFGALHQVLRSSWHAKRSMASSISNSRLDSIYELALKEGASCGKISGAGGGGFMMFLADPTVKNRVIEALLHHFQDGLVFGCHFTSRGGQAWRVQ